MQFVHSASEFTLKNGEDVILRSGPDSAMVYVGQGRETVKMHQGNFDIQDYVVERRPLTVTSVEETAEGFLHPTGPGDKPLLAASAGR